MLLKGELESGFTTSDITLVNVQQALPRILALSSFITLFAMALLGAFITLRETHRVIGPVGKMEKVQGDDGGRLQLYAELQTERFAQGAG